MDVIFATRNANKVREAAEILKETGLRLISMDEYGLDADIAEDGETFEDNALIKAREIFRVTGIAAIADDSGLEIDYLDNKPGMRSARFMGESTSYGEKNRVILKFLEGVPLKKRGARFVCAAAAVLPGFEAVARGEVHGRVAYAPAGESGFGYDPIFYVPEYRAAMAELTSDVKNSISHRGKAFRKLAEALKECAK